MRICTSSGQRISRPRRALPLSPAAEICSWGLPFPDKRVTICIHEEFISSSPTLASALEDSTLKSILTRRCQRNCQRHRAGRPNILLERPRRRLPTSRGSQEGLRTFPLKQRRHTRRNAKAGSNNTRLGGEKANTSAFFPRRRTSPERTPATRR